MTDLLSRGTGVLAENITDLGGATVDLQGGVYLISRPLVIPSNYGNAQFVHGTLRASSSWANGTRYLVEVGESGCANQQHSCNMNVGFAGILFDGAHVAGGSIRVSATMGTVIGPLTYHTGFVEAGVRVDGGHETMVVQSWFCEYFWGDKRKENATLLGESAGILINGNDHFVLDTIVAGARNGIVLNGAANLVQGAHTWNDATAHGGRGIVSTASQNRFIGVYMDFTDITLVDPTAIIVEDSFFLGGGRIELVPSKGVVNGLDVRDCEFWDAFNIPGGEIIITNSTAPWASGKPFASVTDATVSGTTVQSTSSFHTLSPVVTRTARTDASGSATIDFGPHMPFDGAAAPIQAFSFSVASLDGSQAPQAMASLDAAGLSATVRLATPKAGVLVTATADQSKRSINA